ncbi:MAG: hypothetical protein GF416_00435 [Candidatus Altiarchaeales archaeon]|nr:hypothetical protein [Candidatus Altiarchaeales archaeon]
MFGRRGQGAMEYLMTYGWAILVVMVVGIAMWRLGIFNMGGTTVTSTGFAKIKPQLAGTGIDTAGTFKGIFTNGVGTTITIRGVSVSSSTGATCPGDQCATANSDVTQAEMAGAGQDISAGENFYIELICGGVGACGNIGGDRGEVYDVTVGITYDVSIGTSSPLQHTESGTIRGPYE